MGRAVLVVWETRGVSPANAATDPDSPPERVLRGSAKLVLFNVLGELVMPSDRRAPTTALMKPLEAMGVSRHAARQAIQRCAQEGWIEGRREGRESHWALSAAGHDLLSDGIARTETLGDDFEDWDGSWIVVFVSVPQARRAIRPRLYRALQWGGFGSPTPGVWVSPRPERRQRVATAITECGLGESCVSFTGASNGIGLNESRLVEQAWDLPALAEHYADLVDRFTARRPRTPEQSLWALLELDDELQPMPLLDPHLPRRLAPGWPGRGSARTLLGFRRRWLGPAREHWSVLLGG